jgi:antibiotic biosynthesis monooxygenase (ABM) superfamily enzyme
VHGGTLQSSVYQPVGPPRWKLAALSWFGIFPVVTAMLALAEPWLDQLPLVARTFALTAVLVPAMAFVVMPPLTWAFRPWLQR